MLPPVVNEVSVYREHFPLYMNEYISDKLISGESKEMVFKRCLPYWNNTLFPYILSGKTPLIVTHKHTVRVLMKHLLDISDEKFVNYKFNDKEMLCVSINKNGKAVYTKKIMIE
jgi:2,3-bisphosphoglycerate-dependent phosphoglycerate mutase